MSCVGFNEPIDQLKKHKIFTCNECEQLKTDAKRPLFGREGLDHHKLLSLYNFSKNLNYLDSFLQLAGPKNHGTTTNTVSNASINSINHHLKAYQQKNTVYFNKQNFPSSSSSFIPSPSLPNEISSSNGSLSSSPSSLNTITTTTNNNSSPPIPPPSPSSSLIIPTTGGSLNNQKQIQSIQQQFQTPPQPPQSQQQQQQRSQIYSLMYSQFKPLQSNILQIYFPTPLQPKPQPQLEMPPPLANNGSHIQTQIHPQNQTSSTFYLPPCPKYQVNPYPNSSVS